jgi:hypothetical protein
LQNKDSRSIVWGTGQQKASYYYYSIKMKNNRLLKFLNPNINISENLAIVGSSISILKNNFGDEINTYQDVIRFNRSPVKNYEKFVGSKTTIRVVNNVVFESYQSQDNENQKDSNSITLLEKTKIITITSKIVSEKKKYIPDNSNNYFFLKGKIFKYLCIFYLFYKFDIFVDLLKMLIKRKNFSVGFATIILCVISGIKPTLFGFDVSEDMSLRSHYWESSQIVKPSERHDLNMEHVIIKKLNLNNLIRIRS